MTDQNVDKKQKDVEETVDTTAESEKADNKQEHMIPKSRLDEVLKKNKELEDRLNASDIASKEAEEQRLKDQEQWQELAEKRQQELEALKPKAAVAEDQEKSLRAYLEAQIKEIPEDMQSLIPEQLSTMQKLDWLSVNRAKLLKPVGPNIGAGERGAGGGSTIKLTPEEQETARLFNYTDEEYVKYKDGMPVEEQAKE